MFSSLLDGVALVDHLLGEFAGRIPSRRLQVVLVHNGRDTGITMATARKLLDAHNVPMAELPADVHLATGARVSLPLLSDAVALALTEIAAQTLEIVTAPS